jgi:maleate isomerase
MEAEADACAERLGTAEVDVVAYGCTTGSLVHGPGHEEDLEARLSRAADAPAVATAASVKRAFDALGLESLAVATPYIDDLNDREETFLEAAGYDVVELAGRGLEDPISIGSLSPADAYRDAVAVDRPAADGVFVSCTDFRTFEVIEQLEADLGKPVVTSNQATLWDALRTAGVGGDDPHLGELFRAH